MQLAELFNRDESKRAVVRAFGFDENVSPFHVAPRHCPSCGMPEMKTQF
ncbi:hypothetical protein GGP84_000893 [Salinibacter ruber]|jgi:hypothetical protein|nr:hypothetical protein [Salinibacter ruber]